MAGSNPAFDPLIFRTAIRNAMTMGLPNSTAERATFKWKTENSFDKADAHGNPWNWETAAATTVAYADVQIPVAVTVMGKGGDTLDTRVGEFDTVRVKITVLDQDYVQLTQGSAFADQVEFDGALYDIQFVEPPVGLFQVTIYTIHCQAVDES